MRKTVTVIATICLLNAACGGTAATASSTTSATTAPAPTTALPEITTSTTTTVPGPPPGTVLRFEYGPDDAPIEYYAYLPKGHDGVTPLPLIIGLHGYTQTPSSTLGAFPLSLLDERGYAWLAPPATDKEGRSHQWAFITTEEQSVSQWPENPPGGGRYHPYGDEDVERIVDVLDDFTSRVPIDTDRVYAWGYSGGAWMSVRLACDLSELLVAVAAGTSGVFFPEGCTPAEAIPIISFGTTDDPYHPAEWTRDGAHQWAEFQGCDPPETSTVQSNEFLVGETRYANCRDGAEIVLVLVEGAIPGIWFNSESPWAGDLAPPYDDPPALFLDFFEAHTG